MQRRILTEAFVEDLQGGLALWKRDLLTWERNGTEGGKDDHSGEESSRDSRHGATALLPASEYPSLDERLRCISRFAATNGEDKQRAVPGLARHSSIR
jgi:hypothetical protein